MQTTRALGEAVAAATRPPRVWLQASTATIYADTYGPANDEHGTLGGNEPGDPGAPARSGLRVQVAAVAGRRPRALRTMARSLSR